MTGTTDNLIYPSLKKVKGILENPQIRPALEEGSFVGDDKFGKASKYDTGLAPSIALNDSNVSVEVHQSEWQDTLWYHVGKIEGNKINWGGSIQYDTGINPSVAINNQRLVVEVHQSEGLKTNLWYHVGRVEGNKINWGGSIQYDNGANPSVAITDDGLVVEVHKSETWNTLWYHVGRVEGNKINWGGSIQYDNGANPSVAITDDGLVVEVHKSETWDTLWYHVGRVEGNKINWGGSIQYDKGINPSIAITNDGLVVEVHQSEQDSTLWCHIGRVEGNKISWGEGRQYDRGSSPRVACNAALAVEAHNSDISTLSYSILRLPSFYPRWIEARGSNSYCYYQLDNYATEGQRIATSKTIKVDSGAPCLYAILTKEDNSVDFPTDAMLVIQKPDGTVYNQESNQDNLLVKMSGGSLRYLLVKNPQSGDWVITLRVFEGVDFHFEFATIPSQDTFDTINPTLSTVYSTSTGRVHLQKRDLVDKQVGIQTSGLLGLGTILILSGGGVGPTSMLGYALDAVAGILYAGSQLIKDFFTNNSNPTPIQISPILHNAAQAEDARKELFGKVVYEQFQAQKERLAESLSATNTNWEKNQGNFRVATWNIGNRFFLAGIPLPATPTTFRMALFALYGAAIGIDIIVFQEAPRELSQLAIIAIQGITYNLIHLPREYPENTGPNRGTQKAYLVLFNPNTVSIISNPQIDFFQQNYFYDPHQAGNPQCRPPAIFTFHVKPLNQNMRGSRLVGQNISFSTWHNEVSPRDLSAYLVYVFSFLVQPLVAAQPPASWIIAGDFNWANMVKITNAEAGGRIGRTQNIFTNFRGISDGIKDHILTTFNCREVKAGLTFESDSGHLALIADISLDN